MNTKKVLHILKSSEYSGAEKIAITIIKSMSSDYDMIYLATEGSIREKLEEEDIKYVLLNKYSRENIKKIVDRIKPDVIHAHDFTASVICASLKKNFLLVSHLHNDPLWVRKWNIKTVLYTLSLKKIDKVFVVSNLAYKNFVFKKWCIEKTKVIGNPLDKNELIARVSKESWKKKYDLIFCGRMEEQKNPDRFIEIVEQLVNEGLDIKAVMLGRGHLLNLCQQQLKEKNLEKNIEIVGFVDNPYDYMAQSKILCMPSRWEGFGLVAAEANLIGVPVLGTRAVGLLELYGEAPYEYCDTDDDFCRKIKELLTDTEIYEKVSRNSLEKAEKFTRIDLYREEIRMAYEGEKQ